MTLINYCNHELQQLCLNNDGKYIHIEGDQLLHYTKNGIESHKL